MWPFLKGSCTADYAFYLEWLVWLQLTRNALAVEVPSRQLPMNKAPWGNFWRESVCAIVLVARADAEQCSRDDASATAYLRGETGRSN
jgi:hypothetical protein